VHVVNSAVDTCGAKKEHEAAAAAHLLTCSCCSDHADDKNGKLRRR
jgi:hypothetical protein